MSWSPNRLSAIDRSVFRGNVLANQYARPLGMTTGSAASRSQRQIDLMITEWVSHFVRIKDGDTGLVKPVEFSERRYLERPYNSGAKRVLLLTSRQTEKSTSIGNKLLALAGMRSNFMSLFVSPSAMQTAVFSKARLDDIIDISPNLKALTHKALTMNILEKEFITGSKIYLRYAFLSADRIRGLSVNGLFADEIQDLLRDVMPVIEETTSRFANSLYVYSGTPKTLDNTIEHYWSRSSTQNEWVIPCEHHGASPSTWHWNVLGLDNLGKTGPICDRCGKPLNPEHPNAGWVQMSPGAEFEGFRICRLMVPWFYKNPDKWQDILKCLDRYPKAQFMNEVMAVSYDSGTKPLTTAEMMRACDSKYDNDEDSVAKLAESWQLYAGVDWGCHDDQTRVLTKRGFVYFADLTEDDLVAQWDPETREMTFVKPKARTVRDWNRPLLRFANRGGLDLVVTDTHRMRVSSPNRPWVTESAGETAARGGAARFVGKVSWVGEEQDTFVLPAVPRGPGYSGEDELRLPMDRWLAMLGYLVTEGGVCFSADRAICVKMSQREAVNPGTTAEIRGLLAELGLPHTEFPNRETTDANWTLYGKRMWKWYSENLGVSADTKRLPRWVFDLGVRQIRILFDAMVSGDGYRDPRPGCTGGAFYSTSKQLCEDFQELCIRLGLRSTLRPHKPAEGNRNARWRVLWSEGKDFTFNAVSKRVEHVPYSGKVYCCAVDTGYIVTERNGCVSYQGNTGENTYTVLTIGGYVRPDSAFQILYSRRFDGQYIEPDLQLAEIERIVRKLNVKFIGTDYGGGFVQNKHLVSRFGPQRVHTYQYQHKLNAKIQYKPALHRNLVFRSAVMADVFNAIKKQKIRFPSWERYKTPYADDCLSIVAEYSDTLRMIKYDTPRGVTDDTFHSVLYCLFASMLDRARPDIIAPIQETDNGQGFVSEGSLANQMMEMVDPQGYGVDYY